MEKKGRGHFFSFAARGVVYDSGKLFQMHQPHNSPSTADVLFFESKNALKTAKHLFYVCIDVISNFVI